eukprot:TRINITY_DN38596_c0_g1_i1.p1 TRINITY_DN38596_c0_g1~~TRINITY_DN38596_c0_g1_i1.p1  ORF type:complete len:326 (+),score=37.71 TRINITY_DN38596_c0_g1_i1:38-979(+)
MPLQKPQPKTLQRPASVPAGIGSGLGSTSASGLLGSTGVALYATPSYSSLYAEPEDLEPGPGTYDIPNAFGYQQLSNYESGRSSSLTAKHDKSWAKIMITKDHLGAIMGRGTPGPGSYQPRMVQSQRRVRIGNTARGNMYDTSFRAPGPVYDVCGAPDNPPHHIRFSKAHRFDADNTSLANAIGSTGPGMYEVSSFIDEQKHSKSFGAGHRAYDRVRFPGSEKEGKGKTSPGPGALQPFQNTGKAVPFARADRLPEDTRGKRAPGPGAYDVHDAKNPDMKSQSVYSFGRPSAKGRVDWKQYKVLGASSMWGAV